MIQVFSLQYCAFEWFHSNVDHYQLDVFLLNQLSGPVIWWYEQTFWYWSKQTGSLFICKAQISCAFQYKLQRFSLVWLVKYPQFSLQNILGFPCQIFLGILSPIFHANIFDLACYPCLQCKIFLILVNSNCNSFPWKKKGKVTQGSVQIHDCTQYQYFSLTVQNSLPIGIP